MADSTRRKEAAARRRDGRARQEALLDAALACFDEKGVLGTGIEEIRRRAGASPSSVYHLFGGIDGILLAVLERTFTRLFAHLSGRVGRTLTPREAVLALVDGHIEWVAAHRAEGRVMYQAMTLEVGGLDAQARQALATTKARALQPVVDHLAPFVRRGELPAWSPPLFDVVVLGPAHEALRRWLGGSKDLDPKRLRALLPDLAWRIVSNVPDPVPPRGAGRRAR